MTDRVRLASTLVRPCDSHRPGRVFRRWAILLAGSACLSVSCSDDDGANVQPNSRIPGMGGSGDSGVGGSGGDGGASGANAGASGGGNGGSSGDGGAAGCTPVDLDAGVFDAGLLDAGDGGGSDASVDASAPAVVSFASDIHPVFVQRCGPCHVTDSSAGHNVGGADVSAAYTEAVALGQTLVDRVNGGGMPPSYAEPPNDCQGGPGDPGCLTLEEFELLQTWVAQCSPP